MLQYKQQNVISYSRNIVAAAALGVAALAQNADAAEPKIRVWLTEAYAPTHAHKSTDGLRSFGQHVKIYLSSSEGHASLKKVLGDTKYAEIIRNCSPSTEWNPQYWFKVVGQNAEKTPRAYAADDIAKAIGNYVVGTNGRTYGANHQRRVDQGIVEQKTAKSRLQAICEGSK